MTGHTAQMSCLNISIPDPTKRLRKGIKSRKRTAMDLDWQGYTEKFSMVLYVENPPKI
jgi:hypothetical protein